MKLQKQVCSLDLAKRLKELGVKQESIFGWVEVLENEATTTTPHIYYKKDEHPEDYAFVTGDEVQDIYAAFTVAELGEMLPYSIRIPDDSIDQFFGVRKGDDRKWAAYYGNGSHWNLTMSWLDTEADARAKMLIYLLENHLTRGERGSKAVG